MANNSQIEWTEATWNPVTGCSKISSGCKHCYAARMANRLQAMGVANYRNGFEVTTHEHVLSLPLTWRKPRTIFVNSMSDLFHKEVPLSFIKKVFEVMNAASQHSFQVLTKRADRVAELSPHLPWSQNIWMGVSVEDSDFTFRIDLLRKTGARVKFLSIEPLLGPIKKMDLRDIDWVIVGGESGPGARPMNKEWVLDIRNQCSKAGVPFFFKQWGGVFKKHHGRELDGRTWDEMPRAIPVCA
jgi:protein gp37